MVSKKNISEIVIKHREMVAALLSGLLTVLAWLSAECFCSVFLYICSYAVGSYAKTKSGIFKLLRTGEIDVSLLMFLAAVGAAVIGCWFEGAMLIFIFALSGALEEYALDRSDRDISALISLYPDKACVILSDGSKKLIDITDVKVGDHVVIKAGEIIPVDARVLKGTSYINQAAITGESLPVDAGPGKEIFAGTLNGSGSLTAEVLRASKETVFSKIIALLKKSKETTPNVQQGIDRLQKVYIKVVLLLTLLFFIMFYFLLDHTFVTALHRTMVFLVVTSPCALVTSVMPGILSSLANAAKQGILLKAGRDLETLAKAKVVVFDKTGTLTTGKPQVTRLLTLGKESEFEILKVASSLESMSDHPIAKAIVAKAEAEQIKVIEPESLKEHIGYGVEGVVEGQNWRLGKPSFFEQELCKAWVPEIEDLESMGQTVILLGNKTNIIAIIALQDTLRQEASYVVRALKQMGLLCVILTGDQKLTAEAVGKELGLSKIYSELLPIDKVNILKELQQTEDNVIMIGDGLNDAPALATAQVGIALGKGGNNITIQNADIIFTNDDLCKLVNLLCLARKAEVIIKQNMFFSITVICTLLVLNLVRDISLPWGVVFHEGSTLLVILNGLRLLGYKCGMKKTPAKTLEKTVVNNGTTE